jgi:hypothetical protein
MPPAKPLFLPSFFSINSLFDPAPEAQTIIPRPDHLQPTDAHSEGKKRPLGRDRKIFLRLQKNLPVPSFCRSEHGGKLAV